MALVYIPFAFFIGRVQLLLAFLDSLFRFNARVCCATWHVEGLILADILSATLLHSCFDNCNTGDHAGDVFFCYLPVSSAVHFAVLI